MSDEESSMLISLLSAIDTLQFRLTLNEPNLDVRLQHDQPGYVLCPHSPETRGTDED